MDSTMNTTDLIANQSFFEALKEKYLDDESEGGNNTTTTNIVVIVPKRRHNSTGQAKLGHLRTVVLNGKDIVSAGINQHGLAEMCPNVVDLDLAFNKIRKWSEVETILHHLPHLKYVSVNDNPIRIDAVSDELPDKCLMIETVALSRTFVSIDEAFLLSDLFPCLKELQLCGNGYDDLSEVEGKIYAGAFSNLECLRLNSNTIQKWTEVWKLRNLPKLKSLILSNNPLSAVFYKTDPSDKSKEGKSGCEENIERGNRLPQADSVPVSTTTCEIIPSSHDVNMPSATPDHCLTSLLHDGNSSFQPQGTPNLVVLSFLDEVIDNVVQTDCISSTFVVENRECKKEPSSCGFKFIDKHYTTVECDENEKEKRELSEITLEFNRECSETVSMDDKTKTVLGESEIPEVDDDGDEVLAGLSCAADQKKADMISEELVKLCSVRANFDDRVVREDDSISEFCEEKKIDDDKSNDQSEQGGNISGVDSLHLQRQCRTTGDNCDNESNDGDDKSECILYQTQSSLSNNNDDDKMDEESKPPPPDVLPFNSLEMLCVSSACISCDEDLHMLCRYPKLRILRIQCNKLYADIDIENRRKLYIASLPNITKLNGSEISPSEREKAERHYLQHFKNSERKPSSFNKLVEKHGLPPELVDIDLKAGYREWATLKFFYQGKEKFSKKVRVLDQVGKLRSIISRQLDIPKRHFTMLFNPCNSIHPVCERDLIELRCESLPMSRLNFSDGDEIHVDDL